jgi:hypothetical protein
MVMGGNVQQIHDQSVSPLMKLLERQRLRRKRFGNAEKWEEMYSLIFAFVAFLVFPPSLYIDIRFSGAPGQPFSAVRKDGLTLKESTFA